MSVAQVVEYQTITLKVFNLILSRMPVLFLVFVLPEVLHVYFELKSCQLDVEEQIHNRTGKIPKYSLVLLTEELVKLEKYIIAFSSFTDPGKRTCVMIHRGFFPVLSIDMDF